MSDDSKIYSTSTKEKAQCFHPFEHIKLLTSPCLFWIPIPILGLHQPNLSELPSLAVPPPMLFPWPPWTLARLCYSLRPFTEFLCRQPYSPCFYSFLSAPTSHSHLPCCLDGQPQRLLLQYNANSTLLPPCRFMWKCLEEESSLISTPSPSCWSH